MNASGGPLLPYNATRFELDVEKALRYNVDPAVISGFKFSTAGDNLALALSWEYSLAPINIDNFQERIVEGLKFYRLAGTPYALRMAMSWYGFNDIKIEEEEPGRHFAEFQIGLKGIPNNLDISQMISAAQLAAPLRSRLSRMYNDLYDIRRFIPDYSDWGDLLSDHSGNYLYEGSPKFSFGRVNTFDVEVGQSLWDYSALRMHYAFAENNDRKKLDWTIIDNTTGATSIEPGKIYLQGLVRDVNDGNFTIPVDMLSVRIGVYFKAQAITELEDDSLRDPAVGTRNFQEVGAIRTQYQITWGYQAQGVTDADSDLGEFYTIYNVEKGVLVQKALAPQMESVNTALARYDSESNGSYVVKRLNVTCLVSNDETQTFSINEGKAHVNGYEIELAHSLRTNFDNESDIQSVESDPYVFEPDAMGNMVINLNYTPLASVKSVDITAEKKINLTHGSYAGALDPIPSTSVLEIMQIKQGSTLFVKGTDYKLTAGQVDWSLSGNEPAPGSTYEIT